MLNFTPISREIYSSPHMTRLTRLNLIPPIEGEGLCAPSHQHITRKVLVDLLYYIQAGVQNCKVRVPNMSRVQLYKYI